MADNDRQYQNALLRYLSLNASGSERGGYGRVGVEGIPLTNSLRGSVGATGWYDKPEGYSGMKGAEYDAMLRVMFGDSGQHNIGVGGSGLGTPYPRANINYNYRFK